MQRIQFFVLPLGLLCGSAAALEVASLDSNGEAANITSCKAGSFAPAISDDGRFVAFATEARFLIPGDNNFLDDVYVYERDNRQLERISSGAGGVPTSGGDSFDPDVSADGRFVTFISNATNIVTPDTASDDVFLHDRLTGETVRVSEESETQPSNNDSLHARISGDGNWVAFVSRASNLVPGDTNNMADVFLWERATGNIEKISRSITMSGTDGDAFSVDLSFDGDRIAFDSIATNMVTASDSNLAPDIFLYTRQFDVMEILSIDMGGSAANGGSYEPVISKDGRFIAYATDATNVILTGDFNGFTDIVRLDRDQQNVIQVSTGPKGATTSGPSFSPSISADGRTVAFASDASDIVDGDTNGLTDVFQRKLDGSDTVWVSSSLSGGPAAGSAFGVALNGDGQIVAFDSDADSYFPGDDNACFDVFIRDLAIELNAENLLPPTTVGPGDEYGKSVGGASNFLAAGIPNDAEIRRGGASGTGKVAVYRMQNGGTVSEGEVLIPDGMMATGFGSSISMTPAVLAVGAPETDTTNRLGPTPLQLALFDRLSGDWSIKQTLTGSNGGSQDMFGSAVAFDGNMMFVGAPMDQSPGEQSPTGAVYVYNDVGGSFTFVHKIKPPTPTAFGMFGFSISANNGQVAVGAPNSQIAGATSGVVELFQAIAGNLQPMGSITPAGMQNGDQFGQSIALSNGQLVIGAPGVDLGVQNSGAAFVFTTGGSLLSQLSPTIPQSSSSFGQSVAFTNGLIGAGAPGAPGGGGVFIFNTEFGPQQQFVAQPGQLGFGSSLASISSGLVVGAPLSGVSAGAAVVVSNDDILFREGFE